MVFAQQFSLQGRVFNLLLNSLKEVLLLLPRDDRFHCKDLQVVKVLELPLS